MKKITLSQLEHHLFTAADILRGKMDADHVAAWSKGGETNIENCQMLCKQDNRTKSGI